MTTPPSPILLLRVLVCAGMIGALPLHSQTSAPVGAEPLQSVFAPKDDAETAFKKITGFHVPEVPDDAGELGKSAADRERYVRLRLTRGILQLQRRLACRDFYARFPDSPRYAELWEWERSHTWLDDPASEASQSLEWSQRDGELDPRLSEESRVSMALSAAYDRRNLLVAKGTPRDEAAFGPFLTVALRHRTSKQARDALIGVSTDPRAIPALRKLFPDDPEITACIALLESIGKPCEFQFTALDDRKVDSREFRGKVVLLDFWASDCAPCVEFMPELKSLADHWGPKGFAVIGVSLDVERKDAEKIIQQFDLSWPQYFDGKNWQAALAKRFLVTSIPHGVLIDRQGNLHSLSCDPRLPDGKKQIEALLAQP